MYNRYQLYITKLENDFNYKLIGQEKLECQARIELCNCGILYTQPIVSKNGTVEIQLFVSGLTRINNKLERTGIVTESGLDSLIFDLASHHNIESDILYHSFTKAKKILNINYGENYNLLGCHSQA